MGTTDTVAMMLSRGLGLSKAWIDGKFISFSSSRIKQPTKMPSVTDHVWCTGACSESNSRALQSHMLCKGLGRTSNFVSFHSRNHEDRTPSVQLEQLPTYQPQHIADSRKKHISRRHGHVFQVHRTYDEKELKRDRDIKSRKKVKTKEARVKPRDIVRQT